MIAVELGMDVDVRVTRDVLVDMELDIGMDHHSLREDVQRLANGLLKTTTRKTGKITDYLIKNSDFQGIVGAKSFLQKGLRKFGGGGGQNKMFGSRKCAQNGNLTIKFKKSSRKSGFKGAKSKMGKGKLSGTRESDSSQFGVIDFLRRKSRLEPGNSLGSSKFPNKT